MQLRVLGNVEIHEGGTTITLPRSPERCVLAALALNPGHRVHIDSLIEYVWGERPPRNAADTIASYVRTVRRAVEDGGGRRDWLRNLRPGSYQLDIDPDLVDYHRFVALVADARGHERGADIATAVDVYQQAIALRRGEALANVTGQWAEHRRYALEQEYLDALCSLYEQQLDTGAATAVATSAINLITRVVPTDRMIILGLHGLARSGRHATIQHFLAHACQRLRDTVDVEPSAQVYALARDLAAHPRPELPTRPGNPAGTPSAPSIEPLSPPDMSAAQTAPADDRDARGEPDGAGRAVTMTANFNGQVFQAGGDQYIGG